MSGRHLLGMFRRLAPPAGESDGDLLGRYVRDRDGAAFEVLVRRHGPMVLGVCRRALGDGPDAEDAFQATFLVLVRKAASVSPRGLVGNWLHGVARRTAAHARAARRRLGPLPDVPDPRPHEPDDLASVLDAELAGLPERYRAAVVLCELEGRPIAEVAGVLGVPVGTVASRLARGRKQLADRLTRRGVALPTLLATGASPAVAATPRAAELVHAVLKEMLVRKLKLVGFAVLACGALAAGVAAWAQPNGGNEYAGRLNPKGMENWWLDNAWRQLGQDEPQASRALLALASKPKESVPYLKDKLPPLKLTPAEAKKLIADLGSDDEKVWMPAYTRLDYLDPRLAMTPEAALDEAKAPRAALRLAVLLADAENLNWFTSGNVDRVERESGTLTLTLTGVPPPGPWPAPKVTHTITPQVGAIRRRSWVRATRAAVLLHHVGGDDVKPILKGMAAGHPDALPTTVAKQGYVDLTRPVIAP